MTRIAFIGAGSVEFTKNLLGDILSFPELHDAEIALHDIDPERLAVAEAMARYTAGALGAAPRIEAHLDRRRALEGADYVINMIQVGGYEATLRDFEIPAAYGLRQTIGDTLGIGGIFRALRTIPVMRRDRQRHGRAVPGRVAPQLHQPDGDALLGDLGRHAAASGSSGCATPSRTRTSSWRSSWACRSRRCRSSPPASTTRPSSCGSSATARTSTRCLDRRIEADPELRRRVRVELYRRFGYFPTESSEHSAEYVPWFMRQRRGDRALPDPGRRVHRAAAIENLEVYERDAPSLEAGAEIEIERSQEYASLIIHSIVTGQERVIYGNVRNDGLIDNLPEGAASRCRAWSTERRPADRGREAAAAAGRAQPHVPERGRADGARRARGQARPRLPCRDARPHRRGRALARRRSTRWSTS